MKFQSLTLLLFAALLVSACGTGGEETPAAVTGGKVPGTDSVVATFLNNAPPREIFYDSGASDGFQVILKLENLGEYTIPGEKLKVKLSGFHKESFTDKDDKLELSLAEAQDGDETISLSRTRNINGQIIKGIAQEITFPQTDGGREGSGDFVYKGALAGGGVQKYPIKAEICYPYQTEVSTSICLVEDSLAYEKEHSCDPDGSREIQNDAAPVKVTSLTQSVGGKDKTVLNFEISKVGPGDIYLPGSEDENQCGLVNGTLKNVKFKNKIKVNVNTGVEDLKCSGLSKKKTGTAPGIQEGQITLRGGKAVISCTQKMPTGSDGFKSISLTLDYQVKKTASTQITIKNLNFDEDDVSSESSTNPPDTSNNQEQEANPPDTSNNQEQGRSSCYPGFCETGYDCVERPDNTIACEPDSSIN